MRGMRICHVQWKIEEQYFNEKFVFIRKDVKEFRTILRFVSKRREVKSLENAWDLVVEGFYARLPHDANVYLLHPNALKNCFKMEYRGQDNDCRLWSNRESLNDFYYGKCYSVVILAVLK